MGDGLVQIAVSRAFRVLFYLWLGCYLLGVMVALNVRAQGFLVHYPFQNFVIKVIGFSTGSVLLFLALANLLVSCLRPTRIAQ